MVIKMYFEIGMVYGPFMASEIQDNIQYCINKSNLKYFDYLRQKTFNEQMNKRLTGCIPLTKEFLNLKRKHQFGNLKNNSQGT